MRKETLSIIFAIILVIGSLSRLSIAGWFFIVGIFSVLIFGIIHSILHFNLIKYCGNFKNFDLILVGISHLLFLNLFFFQSDGGDDRSYVVIEFILGKWKAFELEPHTSTIFVVSLVFYLLITIILLLRLEKANSDFSKKKLKLTILTILLVILIPIGFIYTYIKIDDLRDMKKDEKYGKYENLRRASKNKENATYLRLYKYPNSYTSIPKGVFSLYNLEELRLYSNEIQEISPEISFLKKLKILDLTGNKITKIPNEIVQLNSLEELHLSANYIDSINPKICNCKALKKLSISGISLRRIPACLSRMSSLEELFIQSDSINNFMPDFETFINLKELELRTYGGTVRDNQLLAELKVNLPNTKIDIPSSFKPKQ